MNTRMLAYFFRRLQDDRRHTTAEVQKLQGQITLAAHIGDEADQASVAMDNDVVRAQIQQLLRRQESISIHLIEMDQNGTQSNYGYCEETGDPIGLERLYKTPHARFTVEVQQKLERDAKQRNARGCGLRELTIQPVYKPTGKYFGT